MASHGGVGNKFISVNLNKSYGQSAYHPNHPPTGSYGQAAMGRARPGSHGGGAGAGGGMVVLSRPRSSQKAAPKLSVPPPLNLPSLRKEHEKFDLSGPGNGSAGVGGSGSGSRPNSSGIGWTKPGAIALQEKSGSGDPLVFDGVDQSVHATDGVNKVSTIYMPPAASAQSYVPPAEKAMVLRGEDFPSLKAALPTTSGPLQKQKDNLHHKEKQGMSGESSIEQRDIYHMNSSLHMRPHGQYYYSANTNGLNVKNGQSNMLGGSHFANQAGRQEEYPLPLVHLTPRSDWADDERDTGHGFADRGRDHGFTKTETYRDREFEMPRTSILPQKPPSSPFEQRGHRSDETGKGTSSEVVKVDPYRRNIKGHNWRTSHFQKDKFEVQEVSNGRNAIGQPNGPTRDTGRENKYVPPHFGDSARDGVTGNRQSAFGKRSDTSQIRTVSKLSFSAGGKGFPLNDPILNFGREKLPLSKNDRPYLEDPLLKDFGSTGYDERDPFSGGLMGVIKRKKDVVKQAEFHDPVRESFEAELERVQKMQEMERQRIIEEQERVLEQARREEEERHRMIKEEEERRRRLEEEARESAWRAEQERLEVIRRAEEQKLAREEEKRRMLIEEERRKQAAKQKLLELEARMAQRRTEAEKGDSTVAAVANEKVSANMKEKDAFGSADLDDWEESERMVERITATASSDSSSFSKQYVTSSRLSPSREGSSSYLDRGKAVNSWRRDAFEEGNSSIFPLQDHNTGHHSPRRDQSVGVRAFTGKELYGGAGYLPSRTYFKGGMQEPHLDDYAYPKEYRWNLSGDGDPFNRNREIESEIYENISERYGDVARGPGSTRSPRSPYAERLYPNSDADEAYSYGRSRYSMRQPRVLPPPAIASVHKSSFRGENENHGPSTSLENDVHYNYATRSESALQTGLYGGRCENNKSSELVDGWKEKTMSEEQKLDKDTTPRCDSQSSLSVSSPPNSPIHLSHDELDESEDCLAAAEEKDTSLPGNDSVVLNDKSGKDTLLVASSSISAGEDDEWTLENNEEMQEQEEYDEDEDGYQEEDEVHEVDDEHVDLTHEFEDMHLEEKDSSHMMDNLVLGFDEGVEVGLPNDEFERNPKSETNSLVIPEVSVGIVEEKGYADGTPDNGQNLQHVVSSPQTNIETSSRRINETEKAIPDSAIEPLNAPPTSMVSDLLNTINSSCSGPPVQCTVPSSVDTTLHSSSCQPITSAVASVPNQAELPVKLQFGLFTGPSLIPSPVTAIQIGSIQMPLHLHPPVGPSIAHLHPSQPPLFQFGQLRYASPMSQGILPVAPQSMSFMQPNIQQHYNLNQNSGGSLPIQSGQDTRVHKLMKDDVPALSMNNQPTVISSEESSGLVNKAHPYAVANKILDPVLQAEDKKRHDSVAKNDVQSDERGPEDQLQSATAASQFISHEKDVNVSKTRGLLSGNKAKKLPYSVRNYGLRSSFPNPESSRSDSGGFHRRSSHAFQRSEFQIRQSSGLIPANNSRVDDKSNLNAKGVGTSTRSGLKRGTMTAKPLKQVVESENLNLHPTSSQETDSESRSAKGVTKEAVSRSQGSQPSKEGNLKRNISVEDVDAPLQSGVVRVFKQPGIEAPSDEDDFIEVRSKRQMLNDRREQREKQIKAKSRVTKPSRKSRSSTQSTVVPHNSTKSSPSLSRDISNSTRTEFLVSDGQGIMNKEVSPGLTSMTSQQLAPIGTPALTNDVQIDIRSHKSLQTSSVPVVSGGGKERSGLIFETNNKVLDTVQTSLGSWNTRISQQVMALTQTQLDEAMEPAHFDTHVASIGGNTTSVSESKLVSSSNLVKDKSMASLASPINSLLAGEKIQFGAVTSPTVLPLSSSRVVSLGIGAPGLFRSEIQMPNNISKAENDCTLFFEKDKCPEESSVHLEDCEAEAEAAASAVAVAVISSDEIVGNGLGSVKVSDAKNFGGADVNGIVGGVIGDQQSGTQSRVEESLSVSLPADLSVETPPISLWPPLPSPQNSSSQMLSHFSGAPPTHFPFYEMNPMLGGPIFAFGPHEESGGTQSQSQKNALSGPGHLGSWQQCHSTVDSFYGPPAGFTGPYISPPGGIPGVQGPPHMVVYNHYAPVGQFGQVGLSFMGTTYIPSGKQPDWKHSPTPSAMGISEGDMNNMNMASTQRNPPNMSAPIQHLAPGSPLLPMASPMATFDVSPFQSAPDMSVQGRWSHVPASPLHSVPLSLPLQQQAEGVLPSQFNQGHTVEQSLISNRFSESRMSTPSDIGHTFPVVSEARLTQFPDELGLVDSSSSTNAGVSTQSSASEKSGGIASKDAAAQNGSNNSTGGGQSMNTFKSQHSQQKNTSSQQYNHSMGYGYHRGGGASQKGRPAAEWSHRRMGFHGRGHSLGTEKNGPPSKMRQIYVAKQTSSGSSTVG